MMNFSEILRSGLSTGTILIFAAIGEIIAERSGIQNLGVEGMMLFGAMAAFKAAYMTGNVWIALLVAILAGGLLSLAHALVTIHFQADQTVSGLSLTFLGTGLALVIGEGLTGLTTVTVPNLTIPLLSKIPYIGPIFFTNLNLLVYVGYLTIPIAWHFINKTRPGLHMRAVGENPAAADTLGVNVYGNRYFYTFVGGCMAGLAGATISVAVSPGWYSHRTTSGQGWIAVALMWLLVWHVAPLRFGLARSHNAFGLAQPLLL